MNKAEKIILAALISSASVMASFISPELSLLKKFFSLDQNQISQIMTLYLAGYLSGQIVWAYASNRIGRLASIRHGTSISILGAIIIIASMKTGTFNTFLAGRILVAFGLSSGLVCGFALIKESLPEAENKKYLSILAVVFTASIYAAILVSGYIAQLTSLEFIMYMILLYNATMFSLCFCINSIPEPLIMIKKDCHRGKFELHPKVIAYSLALSITTIISYSYALYAPIITSDFFLFSPVEFGLTSLSNMIFIFLGGMAYLKLNKRFYESAIVSLSLLIIIPVCLATLFASLNYMKLTVFEFLILCSLLNLASGIIYPAASYKALEYGSCKATSSAIMNLIKLIMPTIALYISPHLGKNELNTFVLTILLFAVPYVLILQLIKAPLLKQLCGNKITQ